MLVQIIVKAFVAIREHITADQLEVYKTHQKKAYFNALIKPKTLNKDIRMSIVENIRWPMFEKYKCLNNINIELMLEFAEKYTKELYVQALMQGNIIEETAHNIMNSVLSTLNCQAIKQKKYIENRTIQLPQGSHYLRCHALNDKDINTVVCNFYQVGPCSVRIESILDLLMMFVEEPLFDHLRTKEQLGYYVASTMRINYGIAGYSIVVNSQENRFDAAYVEDRIEVFRSKMLGILDDMTEEEFGHVRDSLIKIKQVVDMSLMEEVARNWGEITCEEYVFDRRRREIDILRTLTKKDIIDFCLYNERSNLRKLSVQVIGNKPVPNASANASKKSEALQENNAADESDNDSEADTDNEELFNALANKLNLVFLPRDGDATTIVDIKDFKENLHVYPVTKTKLEVESAPVVPRVNPLPAEIIEEC